MKLLIGLLLVLPLNALVTLNSGGLQCGAQRLTGNNVQTYCYFNKVTLVHNTASLVTQFGVVLPFQYRSAGVVSVITWKFRLQEDNSIAYEVSDNNEKIQKGVL